MSLGLVAVIGLVHDGGRAQRAQSDAFGAAAAAARAGTQELDPAAAASGRGAPRPGPGPPGGPRATSPPAGSTARSTVTGDQVTVTVTRHVDFQVLPGGTSSTPPPPPGRHRSAPHHDHPHRPHRPLAPGRLRPPADWPPRVALAGLLVGPPGGAAALEHWPITGLPSGDQLRDLPTTVVSDSALLATLTVALWAAWALFALCVLVEVAAEIRGRAARHASGRARSSRSPGRWSPRSP